MNILYDKDNLFNISKFFNLNHSYNLFLKIDLLLINIITF